MKQEYKKILENKIKKLKELSFFNDLIININPYNKNIEITNNELIHTGKIVLLLNDGFEIYDIELYLFKDNFKEEEINLLENLISLTNNVQKMLKLYNSNKNNAKIHYI